MVRVGKRWKKSVKHHLFEVRPPPKGQSVDYATAAVLASAWWELSEWLSTPELAQRRDARYAARIRGALAQLRQSEGEDPTLLLVVHRPHTPAVLAALDANKNPEEISSTASDTIPTEEE
jgi:broad specificity phosphatase PhoE